MFRVRGVLTRPVSTDGSQEGRRMPTINQLIRKPRQQKTYREKARHLGACPRSAASARASTPRPRRSRTRRSARSPKVRLTNGIEGDRLHPGRRPQPSGTLGGHDPRRPREGPSGRPLSHPARRARHAGRQDRKMQRRSKYGAKRPKSKFRDDRMSRRHRAKKREVIPDAKLRRRLRRRSS